MIDILHSWDDKERERISEILVRTNLLLRDTEANAAVNEIINDVAATGDKGLIKYTQRFDGVKLTPKTLRVSPTEIRNAYAQVEKEFLDAIRLASTNITKFHIKQLRNSWMVAETNGGTLAQLYRPIERVGIYIPGGSAPLVSTVLMTAMPAKVAGVSQIALCTPPGPEGQVSPYILATAHVIGVNEIYKVGGAQSIAAMAFGTQTIPKVDKIVGPGNIYVTLAKKAVYGHVAIDMIAGPTEIAIIADEQANPRFLAADLLAQAEHDPLSCSILLTTSQEIALRVAEEMEKQIQGLTRREIIEKALKNGAIIVVETIDEAISMANAFASEHLEIHVKNPWELIGRIEHAGCILMGEHTPESVADYFAGPSHVLPTSGTARFSSPLTVDDFVKKTSLVCWSKQELGTFKDDIMRIAGIEGLDAHARAVGIRFEE
ncbi:histidinol dehydrogenase [bacterium]|nr:histidinol dehydrogenase [bacterium]MBU1753339.1 histidinol dehydrogenase [bacterium]